MDSLVNASLYVFIAGKDNTGASAAKQETAVQMNSFNLA